MARKVACHRGLRLGSDAMQVCAGRSLPRLLVRHGTGVLQLGQRVPGRDEFRLVPAAAQARRKYVALDVQQGSIQLPHLRLRFGKGTARQWVCW